MISTMNRKLTLLLGLSVGVMVANLYYAQPLTRQIADSLGLEPSIAGLVVTLTQLGYGLGVLLLVPLGDLKENKRVILTLMCIAVLALIGIGASTHALPYFASALLLGIGVSSIQIVIPYAAHLSPDETRGQVVGSLMSGLMLGIMLSRPISGLLADLMSWHAVFYLSAGLMVGIIGILSAYLPKREPGAQGLKYSKLLLSMFTLIKTYSVLRRRAIYQGFMFAAFSLFWTVTPLVLSGPEFKLSSTAIAIFALVGVAGAISAPFAGRAADKGWTKQASTLAFLGGSVSFLMTLAVPLGSTVSLSLFTIAAVLLDAGVSANLVVGQRTIFALPGEFRGRLNSVFIATIFVGGAFGSFVGAWAFAHGGWPWACAVGFALPTLGYLFFLTERRS